MPEPHYIIDKTLSEFLESNVAILVASADDNNRPTITRGFGLRVSDDCTQLTVFVTDRQSDTILKNILSNGHLATNATRISSYESYQIKGNDAHRCELGLKDKRNVEQYCSDFSQEMEKVGLSAEQTRAVFQSMDGDRLVGIHFTVDSVFCQTPGPGAGKRRKSEQ